MKYFIVTSPNSVLTHRTLTSDNTDVIGDIHEGQGHTLANACQLLATLCVNLLTCSVPQQDLKASDYITPFTENNPLALLSYPGLLGTRT